jgi:hypothetical protein
VILKRKQVYTALFTTTDSNITTGPSLPVQTLTDIQMIGVGVKPAVKLIITAGSWLESAVPVRG